MRISQKEILNLYMRATKPLIDVASIFCALFVQSIAFGGSFNLDLQSQSYWSLFNGTWQKRPRELDYRLGFEIEEMMLQMQ